MKLLERSCRIAWLALVGALVGCPAPAPPAPVPTPRAPTVATAEDPAKPPPVRTSPGDTRRYRSLILDNGLRVLLIHDADIDLAAAALDVHVGHYADPLERQGLAHFLEHMLFMGTDAFPEVDAYRSFIEAHGGSTNAGTSAEHTVYHFEVEHGALAGALDRFAPFFVAPKLDPAYVERERNAVHAEYRLKIEDAWRRGRQVRKATTNPAHPEAKFSVGNLTTLADRPGEPVHADLRALYADTYRAPRMALSVIGREGLDTLEGWVTDRFAAIPGASSPEAAPPSRRPPPFRPDQLGVRIHVESLRDVHRVEVQWPVPPRLAAWPQRPHGYLLHVLGHEGEGSLFARLQQAGWVESLVASYADAADDYDLLSVRMDLTDEGFAHRDEAVGLVFDTVQMMAANPPEARIQEELERMSELAFRFLEESGGRTAVRRAAANLHDYPAEHVLDHWAVWGAFDPTQIRALLGRLTVDRARVIVTARGLETDRTEPLYEVPYAVRPLSEQERTAWSTGTPDPALSLPAENRWLPRDTALAEASEVMAAPTKIVDEAGLEVWHHHDPSYGVPRGYLGLRLFLDGGRDLDTQILARLYVRMLEDSLDTWAYPVKVAGLSFDWSVGPATLALRITGYEDRQEALLVELLRRRAAFTVDSDRFAVAQAELARDWTNRRFARPYRQARRAASTALDPDEWSRPDAVARLQRLRPADLEAWQKRVFRRVSAQLLVHGNHPDARPFADILRTELLAERPAAPVGEDPMRLLRGEITLDHEVDHHDSALLMVFQGRAPSASLEARYRLLEAALATPFFTQLRTEQQLGYVVSSWACRWDVLPGLCLTIQSSRQGPGVLGERMDAFLQGFRDTLAGMPKEELATLRAGLTAKLREADLRLYERSARWVRRLRRRQPWDYHERLAQAVERIDREALLAFFDEAILAADTPRLIVRTRGRDHEAPPLATCRTSTCVEARLRELHERPR